MKYTIYLFTLAFALNACCCKKNSVKGKDAPKTEQTNKKKELSSEERQAGIAEQMKNEKIPNPSEDYYKYAEKAMATDAVARIQRTNCFGRCPVYTLTVFKDGRLEYFGKKFTPREGKFIGKVEVSVVDQLIKKANDIGFSDLKSIYDKEAITDLPSTITSIRTEGSLKTVVNRFDAPNQLREFEKFFDALFDKVEWKQQENE